MMVIAVKYVHDLFCSFTLRYPVKNIAVRYIFKKCPEEHACQKSDNDAAGWKNQLISTIEKHENNYGQVDPPDHKRMSFCHHFKILILEKLGLPFIMDFFEMHINWLNYKFTKAC